MSFPKVRHHKSPPHEVTLVAWGKSDGKWVIYDVVETSNHYASNFLSSWRRNPDIVAVSTMKPGTPLSQAGKAPKRSLEALRSNPTRKSRKRRTVRGKKSDPRRFTRKANTPKKRRQWKHVYRSERARGLAKPRAIRAADSVIKRETVKRNPRPLKPHEHIIQVFKDIGEPIAYWNGKAFTSDRKSAHRFKTSSGAMVVAKELMKRVTHHVKALQVIPA